MSEIILTDANFDAEALKSDVPVFVDFWAPWCGPCITMGPVVDELAKTYPMSKVKICKLNVDDNQGTAGSYQILSIPTYLIFKNGAVADKLIGGISKERLKEFIDKNI
jgi:thioredoxin 1